MGAARRCTVHRRRIETDISPAALSAVIAGKPFGAALGANESVKGWSIFCAEPVERFAFHLGEARPFAKLEEWLGRFVLADDRRLPAGGFCGGWIGYFAYELGRYIEMLPGRAADDIGLPVIHLGFYDRAILYDHDSGQWSLLAVEIEGDEQEPQEKFGVLEAWIKEAASKVSGLEAKRLLTPFFEMDGRMPASNMSRRAYMEAIGRIKRYIRDGEVYQINFSRRFDCAFGGRAADLFRWQNYHNPCPYAALLMGEDWAIVSTSPELFLQVEGDRIRTRPIKGTRPRAGGPEADEVNRTARRDLEESEKERAELAMIVDLERNDLARVCVPGTRHVPQERVIEEYPTVYHAEASVEGRLRGPGSPKRLCEILRATFPGGSITGAPKIRAMEIIDELEPTARGVYTGAIGWIGLNFDLCLNVAIRTITIRNGTAYVQTGGGIVADSDPQAEWEEMLTKARALLAGVAAVNE